MRVREGEGEGVRVGGGRGGHLFLGGFGAMMMVMVGFVEKAEGWRCGVFS